VLALPLAQKGQIDPDIARLLAAWDDLPETARHNLRVVIRSTLKRCGVK
jgi:hypothetical protein